ncbi:nucleotidyltransferase domain-containing protein [Rudaea sp.]|uniref:nucleotidyltransferase family protein n=1 Tax=Rudaea sp. TaxID=2136325 RepID=UPI00321F8580
MAEPMLDMPPEHRRIVDGILDAHAGGREVWAFGSRARGVAKPYSDLDLAVIGNEPLGIEQLAALADAFEESDLPWRVDIVDWATTDAAFRRIIERDKVVLHRAKRG